MADETPSHDEWLNGTAVGFLERTVNAWMAQGLPLPVLARAMIGMGTSCVEGSQGHAAAAEAIKIIRAQLDENRPEPSGLTTHRQAPVRAAACH